MTSPMRHSKATTKCLQTAWAVFVNSVFHYEQSVKPVLFCFVSWFQKCKLSTKQNKSDFFYHFRFSKSLYECFAVLNIKMGKTRPGYKTCPDCFEQVSSSAKICYCGGTLAPKKSNSIGNNKNKSSTKVDVKIRRTERIKRVKPDFYDPLEYERQQKKEKKKRTSSGRVVLPTNPPPVKNGTKSTKDLEPVYTTSHRMHLKTKKKKKKIEVEPPPKEEELEEIILSKETVAKFSLILEEINRKIYASSWRRYND